MAAALKFKGYDYKFEFGDGAHTASTAARSCRTRCAGCGGSEPSHRASAAVHARPGFAGAGRRAAGRGDRSTRWTSKIFPGTTRDYWVYVPEQYDAGEARRVMVFQDGGATSREGGNWRVPVVFDNLIHKGDMPVTIGVFVNPGVVPPAREGALPRFNRSVEYDDVSDRYARFLLEEILPEVGKTYNLTTDANARAIGGASSGAIAAFTAAWNRPDAFRRVFSTIGTYVGLRGGHQLAPLVRKTEPKPLRVYLQDGTNDLNIYAGNWFLANQELLSSLEMAGYDVAYNWGTGAHNSQHGGAILPEALRWLWRGYPAPIAAGQPSRLPVMNAVLLPDQDWQLVSQGHKFTEGLAANAKGEVFFIEIPGEQIYKVGLDGKVTLFKDKSGRVNGLRFGPDGRLYAARAARSASSPTTWRPAPRP